MKQIINVTLFMMTLAFMFFFQGCKAMDNLNQQGQISQLQKDQAALAVQREKLENRYSDMESANHNLTIQMASQQQNLLQARKELGDVRTELDKVQKDYLALKKEKESAEKRLAELSDSIRRQGGVQISPNSSLAVKMDFPTIQDVTAQQIDGNLHISIPGNVLFEPSGDAFSVRGLETLRNVATAIKTRYPMNHVTIEGHTSPIRVVGNFSSGLDMGARQACMVSNVVTREGYLPESMLTLSSCGNGRPAVSNASEAGQIRNYRIEMIIHPN